MIGLATIATTSAFDLEVFQLVGQDDVGFKLSDLEGRPIVFGITDSCDQQVWVGYGLVIIDAFYDYTYVFFDDCFGQFSYVACYVVADDDRC